MDSSLLVQWNVRGLMINLSTIQAYLNNKKPVVLCLQETIFNKPVMPNLDNYIIVHKPTNHGYERGMLTAVRADIPFRINPYINIGIPDHHIIDITISLGNKKIRVINIYRSQKQNTDINFMPLCLSNELLFICGDMNARHFSWDKIKSNKPGRILSKHIEDIGKLHLLNDGSPTYVGGSCLDLTLVSNDIAPDCTWKISDILFSDHHGIETTIQHTSASYATNTNEKWKLNKANWTIVNNKLDELLHNNTAYSTATEEAHQLDHLLNSALTAHVPKTKTGKIRRHVPKWQLDQDYKVAKCKLNKLTKTYLNNKTNGLLFELRQAQKLVKTLAKKAKERTWLNWCADIDYKTTTAEMWKRLKATEGKQRVTPLHPQPTDEANRLIDNFTNRAGTAQLPISVQTTQRKLESRRKLIICNAINIPDIDTDRPFSASELTRALGSKKNTAPGDDGFVFLIIKNTSALFKARLLKLFDMSLTEGKLPTHWKNAIIHCIPKPSDPANPRPISLLSVIDKLMESMLLPRLQWRTGALDDKVRGFTQGRSTQDCISTLLSIMTDQNSERKPVIIFLDLEKAFELASKLAICEMLVHKGVKGKLLSWISDYLTDRTAQVRFQSKYSDKKVFENGTPQGSALSPFLFNLLMESIIKQPFHITTTVLSYADDLVLINTHPTHKLIESELKHIENSCNYLGLKISASKSKAMSVRTRQLKAYDLTLQGSHIEWVKTYRYLGINIDRNCSFSSHALILQKRITARLNIMRRLTSKTHGASYKLLRTYYIAAIRSIIEYSYPAILLMTKTSCSKLNVLQGRALRIMTRSYKWTNTTTLEYVTNIEPLFIRKHKTILKLVDKTLRDETHPNNKQLTEIVKGNVHAKQKTKIKTVSNNIVLQVWQQAHLTTPESTSIIHRHPGELDNCTFVDQLPGLKKSECDPIQLKQQALFTIDTHYKYGDARIYTDGSVNPQNSTAGCGVYVRHRGVTIEKSYRLSDGASSLQTELMAIYIALSICKPILNDNHILIMTDSLGAIQTINSNKVTDNFKLVYTIRDIISKSKHITVIWVPSHTDITGNERADALAKKALIHNVVEVEFAALSISKQNNNINKHCDTLLSNYYAQRHIDSDSFRDVSTRTNLVKIHQLPNIAADSANICYFLTRYPLPREKTFISTQNKCPDCNCTYSLIHHFFVCEKHKDAIQELHLHIGTPEEQYTELTQRCINNYEPIINFCKKHPIPRH